MIRRPPRSTLSLHDALPICASASAGSARTAATAATIAARVLIPPVTGRKYCLQARGPTPVGAPDARRAGARSEEHTSELQSHSDLVCRLLLEKKKTLISRQP